MKKRRILPQSDSVKRWRWLSAGIFAVNITVIALVVVSLRISYSYNVRLADVSSYNITETLQLYLVEKFRQIDLTLLAVGDGMENRLREGGLERSVITPMLNVHLARLPEADGLRVTDSRGVIRYGTAIPAEKALLSVADREYFAALKSGKAEGMVLSKPVAGKIVGKSVIVFARRYRNPDGSFAGIVYATFTIDFFFRKLSSLDIGDTGVVTIFDGDRVLYVRCSRLAPNDNGNGGVLSDPLVEGFIADGREKALFHTVSVIDGVNRFFSFRKIPVYGLYVTAGLGTDSFLYPWVRSSLLIVIPSAVLVLLSFVLFRRIRRTWKDLETCNRSLQDAMQKVRTLSGLLPICASCKRIRDDRGYWNQIESYIVDHTEADFSHSLCPDCAAKLYPGIGKRK